MTYCKTILIVEDDEAIRSTFQQALEFEGYQVFTAPNGREGLQRLSEIPQPCLILLDLMMPIMNGWEFAQALKQNVKIASIPIAVVSAYLDNKNSIDANAYLKKPISLDTLLEVVRQYCGVAT